MNTGKLFKPRVTSQYNLVPEIGDTLQLWW